MKQQIYVTSEDGKTRRLFEFDIKNDKISGWRLIKTEKVKKGDIKELTQDIELLNAWKSEQEASNSDGIINTDKEVRDFLQGFKEGDNLKEKLDEIDIPDYADDEDIENLFNK